jgi:hypothetical protein
MKEISFYQKGIFVALKKCPEAILRLPVFGLMQAKAKRLL